MLPLNVSPSIAFAAEENSLSCAHRRHVIELNFIGDLSLCVTSQSDRGKKVNSVHTNILFQRFQHFTPTATDRPSNHRLAPEVEMVCFRFPHLKISLTFRMMYLSGTVGNICLIAEAKSVMITSAFCNSETWLIKLLPKFVTQADWWNFILPNWKCRHRR